MGSSSVTAAFAKRLFEQHATAVYRYLRRFVDDPAGAEDLMQDVFVRIIRGATTYEHRETDRAWVFRIARNLLVDRQRRAWRTPSVSRPVEPIASAHQAIRLGVREALASLPTEEREAFLLRELGGLSYSEIALATDASVPAVRSRIYRARLALRDMLLPPAPLQPAAVRRYDDDE